MKTSAWCRDLLAPAKPARYRREKISADTARLLSSPMCMEKMVAKGPILGAAKPLRCEFADVHRRRNSAQVGRR